MSGHRCDELRLTGSGGANRVMEAEFKRLVMRSPFEIRVEKPKREGEATLLYPFEARVAWVAACYHRTSSRISWDLCSSEAVRLEPLFEPLERNAHRMRLSAHVYLRELAVGLDPIDVARLDEQHLAAGANHEAIERPAFHRSA